MRLMSAYFQCSIISGAGPRKFIITMPPFLYYVGVYGFGGQTACYPYSKAHVYCRSSGHGTFFSFAVYTNNTTIKKNNINSLLWYKTLDSAVRDLYCSKKTRVKSQHHHRLFRRSRPKQRVKPGLSQSIQTRYQKVWHRILKSDPSSSCTIRSFNRVKEMQRWKPGEASKFHHL